MEGYMLGRMRRRDQLLLMDATPPAAAVQMPMELMAFLSRSWSLSASEISRVLAGGNLSPRKSVQERHLRAPAHDREVVQPQGREQQGRARTVASGAANDPEDLDEAKMDAALASATQLLASHCIEIAELAGADHDQVASAVEVAVDVRSPGDLMTLTSSAATALRGATALRLKAQREARSKAAAVAPYEKTGSCRGYIWCKEGTLLKHSRKGALHRKRVAVYINKKSQVIVKLKSKYIGGTFSRKKKSVLYGIQDDVPAWPAHASGGGVPLVPETAASEKCQFGLRTAQGVIEFQCENRAQKQDWVESVKNLLRQAAGGTAQLEHSFESLLCPFGVNLPVDIPLATHSFYRKGSRRGVPEE